jgi:thymidylate kinase
VIAVPAKQDLVANSDRLRGRLICFSGVDGSGKTSVARSLIDELEAAGVECKYVWLRNARLLCVPFLALCYLTGFAKHVYIEGQRVGSYYFYKNQIVARLWLWISALDMFIVTLREVYFPLRGGLTVVADRYVIDACVDYQCDSHINAGASYPFKLMLRLLPKRFLTVILDIDEEESLQRKSDSLNSDYVKQRRAAYLLMARKHDIPVINTASIGTRKVTQVVLDYALNFYA